MIIIYFNLFIFLMCLANLYLYKTKCAFVFCSVSMSLFHIFAGNYVSRLTGVQQTFGLALVATFLLKLAELEEKEFGARLMLPYIINIMQFTSILLASNGCLPATIISLFIMALMGYGLFFLFCYPKEEDDTLLIMEMMGTILLSAIPGLCCICDLAIGVVADLFNADFEDKIRSYFESKRIKLLTYYNTKQSYPKRRTKKTIILPKYSLEYNKIICEKRLRRRL